MSVRSEKWVGHWGYKLLASSPFQNCESGRLCMKIPLLKKKITVTVTSYYQKIMRLTTA